MSLEATNGAHIENGAESDLKIRALTVQLASIRKLCESGWSRGEPCRLCNHVGSHAETCYVRSSAGWDLLDEHEATIRENDELRAALARHLPVNGKKILAGGRHVSLRDRVAEHFTHQNGG